MGSWTSFSVLLLTILMLCSTARSNASRLLSSSYSHKLPASVATYGGFNGEDDAPAASVVLKIPSSTVGFLKVPSSPIEVFGSLDEAPPTPNFLNVPSDSISVDSFVRTSSDPSESSFDVSPPPPVYRSLWLVPHGPNPLPPDHDSDPPPPPPIYRSSWKVPHGPNPLPPDHDSDPSPPPPIYRSSWKVPHGPNPLPPDHDSDLSPPPPVYVSYRQVPTGPDTFPPPSPPLPQSPPPPACIDYLSVSPAHSGAGLFPEYITSSGGTIEKRVADPLKDVPAGPHMVPPPPCLLS